MYLLASPLPLANPGSGRIQYHKRNPPRRCSIHPIHTNPITSQARTNKTPPTALKTPVTSRPSVPQLPFETSRNAYRHPIENPARECAVRF